MKKVARKDIPERDFLAFTTFVWLSMPEAEGPSLERNRIKLL
jgi:hypothetical protein